MTASAHIPEDELYDYALGEADETTELRIRAHLSECQECLALVWQSQYALTAFSLALPEEAPSAALKAGLMSAVRATAESQAPVPAPAAAVASSRSWQIVAERRERTSPWAWMTAFGAAAAFAAVLAAVSLSLHSRLSDVQGQMAVLQAGEASLRSQVQAANLQAGQAREKQTSAEQKAAVAEHQAIASGQQTAGQVASVKAEASNAQAERERSVTAREAALTVREQHALHAESLLAAMNDSQTAQFILTVAKKHPQPQMRALYRPSTGQVLLSASALPALPAGKVFELWWIGDSGPAAAGVFRPDSNGGVELVAESLPPNLAVKAFAVTIEDAQGATTPTLPIVLSSAN